MCVIIHQPPNGHLEKETAKNLWKVNSDGGGFSFIHPGTNKPEVYKDMEFQPFWSKLEHARSTFSKKDFLIHMRIATHGSVCLENTHPFVINPHTVMAHNGVINQVAKDEKLSDTRVFIRDVLPELPPTWLDSPHLVQMVESFIGYSKLMFLTSDPNLQKQVYILNKHKGVEKDSMWFSSTAGLYTTTKPWKAKPIAVPATYRHKVWINGEEVEFDEYQRRQQQAKQKEAVDAVATAKKALNQYRRNTGLTKPITSDPVGQGFVCLGCDEDLDNEGNCECWFKACIDCMEIANDCKCKGGFSLNLQYIDEMFPQYQGEEYDPDLYLQILKNL